MELKEKVYSLKWPGVHSSEKLKAGSTVFKYIKIKPYFTFEVYAKAKSHWNALKSEFGEELLVTALKNRVSDSMYTNFQIKIKRDILTEFINCIKLWGRTFPAGNVAMNKPANKKGILFNAFQQSVTIKTENSKPQFIFLEPRVITEFHFEECFVHLGSDWRILWNWRTGIGISKNVFKASFELQIKIKLMLALGLTKEAWLKIGLTIGNKAVRRFIIKTLPQAVIRVAARYGLFTTVTTSTVTGMTATGAMAVAGGTVAGGVVVAMISGGFWGGCVKPHKDNFISFCRTWYLINYFNAIFNRPRRLNDLPSTIREPYEVSIFRCIFYAAYCDAKKNTLLIYYRMDPDYLLELKTRRHVESLFDWYTDELVAYFGGSKQSAQRFVWDLAENVIKTQYNWIPYGDRKYRCKDYKLFQSKNDDYKRFGKPLLKSLNNINQMT